MNNREFYIQRWESEQPGFMKVLKALPEGKHDYRPHEKCTPAGALAWQLADEQRQLIELLDTGAVHMNPTDPPNKMSDIAAAFESATNQVREKLKKTTEETWNKKADFIVGGKAVWSDTVGNLFWGYLFDMVHHRGQLTAYMRPMGGKVPSIYGPSADENM